MSWQHQKHIPKLDTDHRASDAIMGDLVPDALTTVSGRAIFERDVGHHLPFIVKQFIKAPENRSAWDREDVLTGHYEAVCLLADIAGASCGIRSAQTIPDHRRTKLEVMGRLKRFNIALHTGFTSMCERAASLGVDHVDALIIELNEIFTAMVEGEFCSTGSQKR